MAKYWNTKVFSQPTAEELKRRAQLSMREAESKGKVYQPVVIQSSKIAETWWGNAWCENLEKYADYGSRLERGKRYVRSGAVIDLKIRKGKINALVQGSRKTPYKVEVRISPLKEVRIEHIMEQCGRRLKDLEMLASGTFPEELKELFTGGEGLFPTSSEISFSCSCPDWALMCKHVAATLYGVGAKLDENPFLFFSLRGIDIDRFIDVTLENRTEQMLRNADCKSDRIIDESDAMVLFGL
jgi:uncharacterized Zn finger protein